MKKMIKLTKGHFTQVDAEDYEYLSKIKWYSCHEYAWNDNVGGMHRVIMDAKPNQIVGHKDRNPFNNTRKNLWVVDKWIVAQNRRKSRKSKNKYKGTRFIERKKLWFASCKLFGKYYPLGYYKTELAAAYAYNKKVLELSDFPYVNPIRVPKHLLEELISTDRVYVMEKTPISKHKGIYWHKSTNPDKRGKWESRFKDVSLGRFTNQKDAIHAYKVAEKKFNKKSK